jgi:hypothetical protein
VSCQFIPNIWTIKCNLQSGKHKFSIVSHWNFFLAACRALTKHIYDADKTHTNNNIPLCINPSKFFHFFCSKTLVIMIFSQYMDLVHGFEMWILNSGYSWNLPRFWSWFLCWLLWGMMAHIMMYKLTIFTCLRQTLYARSYNLIQGSQANRDQ